MAKHFSGGVEISPKYAVTTSHRTKSELVEEALILARNLGVPFVNRDDKSVDHLCAEFDLAGLVVVSSTRISYLARGQEFFFHPGLARLRIKELKYGKTDQMIKAMSLQKGDSVLDCTLGLGTDAIVASFFAGPAGRVTGLEKSPVIAELVRQGLATYPEEDQETAMAMQRVQVINSGHKEYLTGLPPQSYDVVYFDPMFRSPCRHSPGLNALRSLASPDAVDPETIRLALQVAVKRVVLKERRESNEFARLGFTRITGGKYAPVAYGVIEQQEWRHEQ